MPVSILRSLCFYPVNPDGRFTHLRAAVLADAAADTTITQHMRQLQSPARSVRVQDLFIFEDDGLIRQRAHFFAHDAGRAVRPGDAAVFINERVTDDLPALFFEC